MAARAFHSNHFNGGIPDLLRDLTKNSASDISTGTLSNKASTEETVEENETEVDIAINNVVCSFSVRCHLNLRDIALRGLNVEYRKENGMVTMKIRQPYTTANIWNSGKITCTGANSEEQAKIAGRKFARVLQKLGYNTRFSNYRVVNVLGTVTLPFAIRITQFSQAHQEASYEPELHPGVTYKCKTPKATLKIFSTGSITVTAPSVANVEGAVQHIYPLVLEFQKPKSKQDVSEPIPKIPEKRNGKGGSGKRKRPESDDDSPPPMPTRPNNGWATGSRSSTGSNPKPGSSYQYQPKKQAMLDEDSSPDETDSD